MRSPVMLHNGPHPVHERFAHEIDASLIPGNGSVGERVRAGLSSSYSTPVVLEGGVPLIQGAVLSALRKADPVIMLAADETLLNLRQRLPYYSTAATLMHRVAVETLDGVIAVSDEIGEIARSDLGLPAEVAEPFVVERVGGVLRHSEPRYTGETVLCVAENRPSFRQDLLVEAVGDRELIFAGTGTEKLPGGLGRVSHSRLMELYIEADLFVLPAAAGAFPVAPLEAMTAATPAIVTDTVGTAKAVDDRLVAPCSRALLKAHIDWYFDLPPMERLELCLDARDRAERYQGDVGAMRMAGAYHKLGEQL